MLLHATEKKRAIHPEVDFLPFRITSLNTYKQNNLGKNLPPEATTQKPKTSQDAVECFLHSFSFGSGFIFALANTSCLLVIHKFLGPGFGGCGWERE